MISSKLEKAPTSIEDSSLKNKLAAVNEYQLFGPLGEKTYLRYGPESPNRRDYAVGMIRASFTDQNAIESRSVFWKNLEELTQHLSSNADGKNLDLVSDLYQFVSSINPRAEKQLSGTPTGLGHHLHEVQQFCMDFFLTENGLSRIPDLLSNRHAQLLAYVVAPLHDVLKYLGDESSQIIPDHEILLAEVCKQHFTGRTVIINGAPSTLNHDDVQFIAAIIGDHENIFKEIGRDLFLSSQDPVKIAKALFSLADTLAGCLKEQDRYNGVWQIDEAVLNSRFTNLCFRHLDLVEGKTFRPRWIAYAIRDLINTFDQLRECGYKFIDSKADRSAEKALIDAGLTSIDQALEKDAARCLNDDSDAAKILSGPQRVAIDKAQDDLLNLLITVNSL
jgi:hypothetical protein